MILSDREIWAALARGAFRITPTPSKEACASTALDLRLDRNLVIWSAPKQGGIKSKICPSDPDFNFREIQEEYGRQEVISSTGYTLMPGHFVLGWTLERIQLPHRSRYAARVEGKSSLARLGLGVHVTAPTIHAGFGYNENDTSFPGSPLQLEIWNIGPFQLELQAEMPICQLIFEAVDGTPEKGYGGKFSVQGPAVTG